MKVITITYITLATFFLSTAAYAKSPSWNSISASYITLDSKSSSNFDDYEPTGFGVSGMGLVNKNVFVGASYSTVSGDVEICHRTCSDIEHELSQSSFGIGYRHPLNRITDLYGTISYVSSEFKSSYDATGHAVVVGLRSRLMDQFEANISIGSASLNDVTESSYGIGVYFYFNDQASIGVNYSSANDLEGLSLSLNYDF